MVRGSKIGHFIKNGHILMVCVVIITTSIIALLITKRENFADDPSASSVIAPEYDFTKRVDTLVKAQSNTDRSVITDTLMMDLAKEHIPMIMCAFYDLITGPKRAQQPSDVDEGRWIQTLWAEMMEEMGLPVEIYMSVLQLRYNWFTETRDSFETFQSKIEPNFIKATLERYIKSNGTFAPTNVENYKKAITCKMYRTFSNAANLSQYVQARVSSPTPIAQTSMPSMPSMPSPSNMSMPSSSNMSMPSSSNMSMTPTTMSMTTPSIPSPSTMSMPPSTMSMTTPSMPLTTMSMITPSMPPTTMSMITPSMITPSMITPSMTTPSTMSMTTPSMPLPSTTPTTTDTTTTPTTDTISKPASIPFLKWVAPSNFTSMCLDNGNRFQCFLMSVLIVIVVVCVFALIASAVGPMIRQRFQPQNQF